MKCEYCGGDTPDVCPACFFFLGVRVGWRDITLSQLDALNKLGFSGMIDGDARQVYLYTEEKNTIEKLKKRW